MPDPKTHLELALLEAIELPDGMSLGDLAAMIDDAVRAKASPRFGDVGVWPRDVGDGWLIVSAWLYEPNGDRTCHYYRVSWSMTDGMVSIGDDWQEVAQRWVDVGNDDNGEDDSMDEAVERPTGDQRKKLPAAAYAAPFMDGETFKAGMSKLPHHVASVTDPDDDATVDLPRLRNAMARFDQTDFSGFPKPDSARSKARRHLEAHADRLLQTRAEESEIKSLAHHRRVMRLAEADRLFVALSESPNLALAYAANDLVVDMGLDAPTDLVRLLSRLARGA